MLSAPIAWLRRKDPGLASVRRSVRVTLVASAAFYFCRYALGNPVMATYALFGAVALGVLAQIPGSPVQRARTLLLVLPVGAALITLGTLLSFATWAAVAGMFVLGFLVSYAGVGGPRLVGLAAGMQLLYILPCFPPYNPDSLGYRLAGVVLAVVLLAIAELVIWPDRPQLPYQHRLADAVTALAGVVAALADALDGDPRARDRVAALLPDATDAAEAIRPSRLPPIQRPASAARRSQALTHVAGSSRLILGRTVDLYLEGTQDPLNVPIAARLLRQAAASTQSVAAWLRGTGPAPNTDVMADALDTFRVARRQIPPDGVHPDRLRLASLALSVGEWTKALMVGGRVAGGAPIAPDGTLPSARPGPYWFAYESTFTLWWHRFREHLTPRSVYFQGAMRLALALAVARLLAGELNLSHGFWVLLATLTLLRTSAAETRSALRPALVGTVVGAVFAGALLVVGADPTVYVVALPVVMLVGFAAGPLWGPAWTQGLFTVAIALIFAQVAPVDWQIAEARVIDVTIGAAIGALIGLFAWPRGGAGELHRAIANFLSTSAQVVTETVAVLSRGAQPGRALPEGRRLDLFAQATFALYQTEHHDPAQTTDWQAILVSGMHALRGAEGLLRSCPMGTLSPCADALAGTAGRVSTAFEDFAAGLRRRERIALDPPVPRLEAWPTNLGPDLYHLADIRVWLSGLSDDLVRIAAPQPRTPQPSVGPTLSTTPPASLDEVQRP